MDTTKKRSKRGLTLLEDRGLRREVAYVGAAGHARELLLVEVAERRILSQELRNPRDEGGGGTWGGHIPGR